MRKILLCFLLCQRLSLVAKDEPKYPVSAIPESLKEGMYAVIREDFARFEILAINKSRYYVRKAITILNPKGKAFASEDVSYNSLAKVLSISAHAYDANGRLIKKLKNSEIVDHSTYDGFSLYTDHRVKSFELVQSTYPYTVEFEYEIEWKYLYSIPSYYLSFDDEVSIENKRYEVHYPSNLKPRYRLNLIAEPKKEITTDGEKLIWSVQNFRPEKFEPFISEKTFARVLLAPTSFEYDGFKGSMDSWISYGNWQNELNRGRGELSEATRQKVNEITAGAKTTEQKAKIIYEYLQNRTRYVNISEGIGGLQPLPASVVDEVGYGDCKALSNYMVAMLKLVGIRGYYTKIRAGVNEREILDFPSHQTNHIIVGVPNGADTLWMECTNQSKPFGYMGDFTENRYAIMVTEEGGKLVHIPFIKTDRNTQIQKAKVTLDRNGNAKAKVVTTYSGLQYENGNLDSHVAGQADEQRKWLEENIDIPNFELGAFSFKNIKDKVPTAIVNVELTLNRLASVSGKRIFITPNLMNRSTFIPPKNENRKNPIVLKRSYVDVDSIMYYVPEEIYPEFIPPAVKIDSRFGEYESSITFSQGKLLYVRRLKVKPGEFPASSYGEFVDFYKNLNKADNAKLVFLSKT